MRTTSYHEALFKLIDRDSDLDVSKNDDLKCDRAEMNENMKDKALCVVDSKPKTDVLTFWLKDSDGLELDTNTETVGRTPQMRANDARPRGRYMGKQ